MSEQSPQYEPSTGAAADAAATLPAPAPGIPGLVAIHFRLLVRDARAGSALLALLCLLLPLAALTPAAEAGMIEGGPSRVELLTAMMMAVTVFLAFLWPEAVWRNLGPGERLALDALPVSRRSHRMARVLAGAALPLALFASVLLTISILDARGLLLLGSAAAPGLHGVGILVTLVCLLAAYFLSSSLALRFGRPFISLLVILGLAYLVPLLLVIFGFDELVSRLAAWAQESHFSPFRVLTRWYQGEGPDLLPALAWMGVFGGLAIWLAGRHDGR